MKINKLLTRINFENTNNPKRIKYIVIHYVGALGGAEANCRYFQTVNRNASAHYFVGHDGEVWQCVEDADVAWHCGGSSYKHKECRNANSIGIELCCRKRGEQWYFEDATVASAVELTKMLMDKYNIPASNVIRHYDVTGKICPEPFVSNKTKHTWDSFKGQLGNSIVPTSNSSSQVSSQKSYTVRVTADSLNIRKGPGTNYAAVGKISDKGVYTIVEEQNNWGKLKSGAGWISLRYTKKM